MMQGGWNMALKFTRLTQASMRSLPSGKKLTEHGIEYEKLSSGDGIFRLNIQINGKRTHRAVGRESEGITLTKCLAIKEQLATKAREDRLDLPAARKLHMTFAEAAIQYLERLALGDGAGLIRKRISLERHLVPFFGNMTLCQICTFDVERYKKTRSAETSLRGGDRVSAAAKNHGDHRGAKVVPVSKATVNQELATLNHLLNKAVEWGWLSTKKATVKKYKLDNARTVYLTLEQANQLLNEAQKCTAPEIYPFTLIGLETGMRLREILAIRIADIDLGRQRIFVPNAKAGSRDQPISPTLVEFFRQHLAELPTNQEWLFPSRGDSKSGHFESIEKQFRKIVRNAGMDPKEVVRHTLRHTAATHLIQAGVDIPTTQRILGHKTQAMVFRYVHMSGNHIEAAMSDLSERYKSKAS